MSDSLAAEILASSNASFARLAAERVIARLPDTGPYGADAMGLWRTHFAHRLGDLALALADGRPALFVEQVSWAKIAFGARGVPAADLRTSLQCLREVLAEALPPSAVAPVAACVDNALGRWDELGAAEDSPLRAGCPRGRLAAAYVVALLEGDRRRACSLVLDAVRERVLSVREALLEVCLPAQCELGRMWHVAEINVAEEHFVSTTTVRLVSQLVACAEPAPPNGRTVVAACLEGDAHDIGLRVITDVLELEGWRVVFLGGDVPVADLAWAAAAFEADLVMLAASLPCHVPTLARAVAALDAGERRPPVLVGGRALQAEGSLGPLAGAATHARTAAEALARARALVGLDAG